MSENSRETNSFLHKAHNHQSNQDYAKAQAYYQKILLDQPENISVLNHLSLLYYASGQSDRAIANLIKSYQLEPSNAETLQIFAKVTSRATLENYPETFSAAILDCYRVNYIANKELSGVATRYLKNRYQAALSDSQGLACPMTKDKLFLTLINSSINTDSDFERVIISARDQLFDAYNQRQPFSKDMIFLMASIGVQSFLNDYIYPISQSQQSILQDLRQSLNLRLASDLMCYAMFAPLAELAGQVDIDSEAIIGSHPMLTNLIQLTLKNVRKERQLQLQIESVCDMAIGEDTQWIYPRWHGANVSLEDNIFHQLQLIANATLYLGLLKSRYTMLFLGCGTGQRCIEYALANPKADILGVAQSRATLAYAIRMSEQYRLNNLRFAQARSHDLVRAKKQYHVVYIEVQQEQDFLDAIKLTRTNGFLECHFATRSWDDRWGHVNEAMTPERLQSLRSQYHLIKAKWPAVHLEQFYSAGGLHYFLERRRAEVFDLGRIHQLCLENSCQFLGLGGLDAATREAFAQQFPGDNTQYDCACWEQFIHLQPERFKKGITVFLQVAKTAENSSE